MHRREELLVAALVHLVGREISRMLGLRKSAGDECGTMKMLLLDDCSQIPFRDVRWRLVTKSGYQGKDQGDELLSKLLQVGLSVYDTAGDPSGATANECMS